MKKISIALLSIVSLWACSDKKSDKNLHISGNIKGLKKGTLYIQRIADSSLVLVDSISIDGDSRFESHIDLKSPEMLYMFLDRGVTNSIDNSLPFFAEAGNISIDTNLDSFFANAKITGSKNHELYENYKQTSKGFDNQLLDLTVEKMAAEKANNQSELQRIADLEKKILQRKFLYAYNFALTNAAHEVSPFIALTEISNINAEYLQKMQQSMTPKVKESLYGKKLTEYCDKFIKS